MRVIAGEKRGTLLLEPHNNNIRPTTDKVKGALFNMLQFDICDTVFLDLFSGSGSIAIEALSRGAKKAIIIENNEDSLKLIKKNILKTGYNEKAEIIHSDVINWLQQQKKETCQYDFVFMDPPYNGKELIDQCLKLISQTAILKEKSKLIVEHDIKAIVPEEIKDLKRVKQKKYGRCILSIFMKEGHKNENSSISR
jgi:16S rRNA (guanine(966)-N(2))-methyltransferase RsmD